MIIANVATFPGRREVFKMSLESILNQVDILNVYLNDYDEVPDFLKNKKINAVLSRDAEGDIKDNGKFYFLEKCPDDAYYFTIDDDIKYPEDYVSKLVSFLESKNDKVVVGVHGIIFHNNFESFRRTRSTFYFGHGLDHNLEVSTLGTGTLAFKKILLSSLKLSDFKESGMADLWFASFCKKNAIKMICKSRKEDWLMDLHEDADNEYTLWNQSQQDENLQNAIIIENRLWEIVLPVKEKRLISLENTILEKIKEKIRFIFLSPQKFTIKYYALVKKFFFQKKTPKVLAIVNHYYGNAGEFVGKSSTQEADIRTNIINDVVNELKKIPGAEVVICGISGKTLVKIDKDFSYISNPAFLIYESIGWMASQFDKYDYFINIEDDILFSKDAFERIVEFDRNNPVNECYHPNRMEYKNGKEYCVDLVAWPGWTNISKIYENHELRIANNPHSGICVLSKNKMAYAKRLVDFGRRDKIIGHYMASAYANIHAPFSMFRDFSNPSYHKVIHLDNWEPNIINN